MQDAIAVSLVQNNGGELLPSPKSRRNTGTDGDRELIHTSVVSISTIDSSTVSPFVDDYTPTPSPTAHRVTSVSAPVEGALGLDQDSTTVITDRTHSNTKSFAHIEV